MTRLINQKFDPSLPVFARKYFIANGHRYEPGMSLPWRNIGISQRRIVQMFEAGKITHNDKIAVKGTVKPEAIIEKDKALEALAESGQYWDEADADFEDQDILSNTDDLDAIDDMKELRRIADEVGVGYKVSKVDQRQAIRDHRNKETD